MSAEAVAALARVKELEEKLQAIEAEKAAAAAKAEEDARKKVEAQAAARGQAVDPAAVARAQEEARKKSQAEQERKAQAERQRLEEEQSMAEAQLAEERRRAEEAGGRAPPPPPPRRRHAAAAPSRRGHPAPPPSRPAARGRQRRGRDRAGGLNKPSFTYPPIALRQRIEGKVDLSVLVDERGAWPTRRSLGRGRAGGPQRGGQRLREAVEVPAGDQGRRGRQDVDAGQRRLHAAQVGSGHSPRPAAASVRQRARGATTRRSAGPGDG